MLIHKSQNYDTLLKMAPVINKFISFSETLIYVIPQITLNKVASANNFLSKFFCEVKYFKLEP